MAGNYSVWVSLAASLITALTRLYHILTVQSVRQRCLRETPATARRAEHNSHTDDVMRQ